MPMLEVEGLSKSFGGLVALSEVSFALEEGKIMGLIGPNGSGKTTLFNVVAGALSPSGGKVAFLGRDITGLPPHKISRAGIARTFQLSKTFASMSIVEHIVAARLFGGSERAPTRRQASHETGEILRLTGLESIRNNRVDTLGAVDRKKVEVARALGTKPRLLLLDEMMAGLNSKEIEDTMIMVNRIKDSGITVILVEHVMKAVMGISDIVMVLSAGHKIAEGRPKAIVTDSQVIEAYLGEKYNS